LTGTTTQRMAFSVNRAREQEKCDWAPPRKNKKKPLLPKHSFLPPLLCRWVKNCGENCGYPEQKTLIKGRNPRIAKSGANGLFC
jgi:hypothetical protein